MRALFVSCFLAVLLLSCGKGGSSGNNQSASSQQNKPQKESGSGQNEVTIDDAAQQKAGIQVASVQQRALPEQLTAAGQLVMNEERTAHIGTYTDGRVTEIHANLGDFVRRGMVLARLHSHDVHETWAAYNTALESVERQKNMVAYQQRMRDRAARLYQLKSASRQEVERTETDLRSAETDLANAQIAVEKEVAHLTDILNLPPAALQKLNETTEQVPVVSPLSGTVVDRRITPGAVVEPGTEVYTVSDLTSLWMIASVNETDMSKVGVGDKARILSQAYPDEAFAGQVTRLGTELDPKTRTLQVRILVPNPRLKLRASMYVNAQISQSLSRPAIFIPEEALQDINGSAVVFLRKPNHAFEPRPVQVAHRLNGEAEIAAGLQPGDAVVVKGSFVVKSEMLKSQIGE